MRLFSYGTLQFPEVMERLCGIHYGGVPARLDNHVCYTVREQVYPGITPQPGATVSGMLYSGLGRLQLARLDAFESDFYERRRVVVSDALERPCEAWAYVMRADCLDRLSDRPWDRDWFARLHLGSFLAGIG